MRWKRGTAAILLGFFAIAAPGGGGQPKVEAAFLVEATKGNELVVVTGDEQKVIGPTTANRLAWNSPGNRLALHLAPAGSLAVWREGREGFVEVSAKAESPTWSPDGAKLMFRREGELLVYLATAIGSEPFSIAKGVRCAAWSPSGDRIAFATLEGIFVCDADGKNPRIAIDGRTATALTWSPTGRALAFIEPGLGKGAPPNLYTAAVNGTSMAKKGVLDAARIAWGPTGRFMAAETANGIEILDLASGKTEATFAGMRGPALWSGPRHVVGFKDGAPCEAIVGEKDIRTFARLEGKKVVHAGAVPPMHVTNESILDDPFQEAPRPKEGQMALRGTVVVLEPLDDKFTVSVETVIDGKGGQRHFGRPIEQPMEFNHLTVRFTPERQRPLRAVDLKLDDEVLVLVNATKLDARATLSAVSVTIAGDVIPEPGTEPTKARRPAPHISGKSIEYDGVSMEKVVVPMTFPVLGNVWYEDWFLAPRGGGTRRHHGQDLMAKKMTPLVACFEGKVIVGLARPGGHHTIKIKGSNGWTACYYHVNNDTPGTDDGQGGATYAFAPGLKTGTFVYEGQFLGYVGDSGNAETTAPHLHFELWDDHFGAVVNAFPSLKAADRIDEPVYAAPAPELVPSSGESRVDGIVRKLDEARETLRMDLVARYSRGRMRVVTFPTSVWGKIGPQTQLQLRGSRAKIGANDLRPGLQGTIVGVQPDKDRAVIARIGAFEK